jgi:putative Mg2+ transporter-C (MgtC) family protein
MLQVDLVFQTDLAVRLVVAAILGAAIGFEREIHDHPAGMRTHLLVSLGSAIFTELSIFAFAGQPGSSGSAPIDPSRVAAQIVSGIGFLGAGAILKYGTSIRGLTTAASLWTTAAVGMAAGAGEWLIASVGTAIVIVSLWPLNALVERLHRPGTQMVRVRIQTNRLEALGDVSRRLADRRVEIAGISSQRIGKNHFEVELELRLNGARQTEVIDSITAIPDVELVESATQGE